MTGRPARRLIQDIQPVRTRTEYSRPVRRPDYVNPTPLPAISRPAPPAPLQQVQPMPAPTPPAPSSAPETHAVPDKLTVAQHLQELRSRLTWSIIALMVGGIFGYTQRERIINFLVQPLDQQLYYSSPTGGFDFLIKVCLFFGFLVAVPILVFNLLKFIAPALPSRVTYKTTKILVLSTLLALAGASFAYYVSLPAALHFLNNFSEGPVTSLISANEYFNFVMVYMAGFAALFQMPLILSFVNKITPLSPAKLMKKQRVIILASFIIAAILTPTPDPINQTLMAAPIIVLYQSSIGVIWHTNRRAHKKGRLTPEGSVATAMA